MRKQHSCANGSPGRPPVDQDKMEQFTDLLNQSGLQVNSQLNPDTSIERKVVEDSRRANGQAFSAIDDEWERQRLEHQSFAQSRIEGYVERQGLFDELDDVLVDEDHPYRSVEGDSGIGKSALLAAWLVHLKKEGRLPKQNFSHFLGCTPDSSTVANLVNRLVESLRRWGTVTEPVPADFGEVMQKLPEWLAKAGQMPGGVLIVIDALNQLESDHDQSLWWLPWELPRGVRLVVSALPEKSQEALAKRGWWYGLPIVEVTLLDANERQELIVNYLARFAMALDGRRINRLSQASQCGNALFLKVVLDELRLRCQPSEQNARIDELLACSTPKSLFAKVIKGLDRFNGGRGDLAREALGCLAVARRGLTEAELLELLSTDENPHANPLPKTLCQPFFTALKDSLFNRQGRLGFFHDYLRWAVEAEYLSTPEDRLKLHGRFVVVAKAWNSDRFSPSLRAYSLAHGAFHLQQIVATRPEVHETLWTLLGDEKYHEAQQAEFHRIDETVAALKIGIDVYAQRHGQTQEDDIRLAWLSLRCGEVVQVARISLQPIFDAFRTVPDGVADRIESTLRQLQILDESAFFQAGLLLLYSECERAEASDRPVLFSHLASIVDAVVTKIPQGAAIDGDTEWLEQKVVPAMPMDLWSRMVDLPQNATAWRKRSIEILMAAKCWDKALALAELVKSEYDRTPDYRRIVEGLLRAGEIELAKTGFTALLDAASKIWWLDADHEVAVLKDIAGGLARAGEFSGRREWFAQILSSAEKIEFEPHRMIAYEGLAGVLAQAGEFSLAVETAERLDTASSGQMKAFLAIAVALAQAGKHDLVKTMFERTFEARNQWIESMLAGPVGPPAEDNVDSFLQEPVVEPKTQEEIDTCREKSLVAFVSGLVQAGSFPGRLELFNCALAAAESIAATDSQSRILQPIAAKLVLAGEMKLAKVLLERVLPTIDQLDVGSRQRPIALAEIAVIFSRAGDAERAKELFGQALAATEQLKDPSRQEAALTAITNSLVQAGPFSGRQELLIHLLEKAREIDGGDGQSWFMPNLAISLAQAGEFANVTEVAAKVESPRRQAAALGLIIDIMIEAGRLNDALVAAKRIKWAHRQTAICCHVIAAIAETGDFYWALALAEEIGVAKEKAHIFKYIAKLMAQAGELDLARPLLSRALAVAEQIVEEKDQVEVFQSIVRTLEQAGELAWAKEVLARALLLVKQLPDIDQQAEALHEIAAALARLGESAAAQAVFVQGLEVAEDPVSGRYGQDSMLAKMSVDLFKAGNLELARQSIEQIKVAHGQAFAFQNLAEVLLQNGEKEQARELLCRALKSTEKIARAELRVDADVGIAACLAQLGETGQARQVLFNALEQARLIADDDRRSYAIKSIVKQLTGLGEFAKALEAAAPIVNGRHQSKVLVGIADGLVQSGEFAGRKELFSRLQETAGQITSLSRRAIVLDALANALTRIGEKESADEVRFQSLEVAAQIGNADTQASVLKTIAGEMAQTGETALAREVFSQALKQAEQIGKASQRDETLQAIAEALAQSGEFDNALAVTRQIMAADLQDNGVRTIARILAEAGDFSHALTMAAGIVDEYQRAMAHLEIAQAVLGGIEAADRHGLFVRMLSAIDGLKDERRKTKTLAALAKILAQAGEKELAGQEIDRLLKRLDQYDIVMQDWQEPGIIEDIVNALELVGTMPGRKEWFTQVIQVSRRLAAPSDQPELLQKIASALAQAVDLVDRQSLFSQALKLAKEIGTPVHQAVALGKIAEILAQAGELELAKTGFFKAMWSARFIPFRENHLVSPILGGIAAALAKTSPANDVWIDQILAAVRSENDFNWLVEFPKNLSGDGKQDLPWLRLALRLCPQRQEVARQLVAGMVSAHVRSGNLSFYQAVAAGCPCLGLAVVEPLI